MGCRLCSHAESDTTEATQQQQESGGPRGKHRNHLEGYKIIQEGENMDWSKAIQMEEVKNGWVLKIC